MQRRPNQRDMAERFSIKLVLKGPVHELERVQRVLEGLPLHRLREERLTAAIPEDIKPPRNDRDQPLTFCHLVPPPPDLRPEEEQAWHTLVWGTYPEPSH